MKIKTLMMFLLVFMTGFTKLSGQTEASGFTVKGTVISASSGKPLAGAMLKLSGAKPVMTEENGNFTLVVQKKESANAAYLLEASAPGYAKRKYFLTGGKTLMVQLYEEGYQGTDAPVETPFGTASSLMSSYSEKTIEPTLGSDPESTPDGLLQGAIPGLNAVFRSGQVGSGSNMYLQGFNSLVATSQPMFVVDGVPYDNYGYKSLISNYQTNPLSAIDVKDIESITVLKDGTGLYGGKGANGVILIKTLRSKDATTKIEAHVNVGISLVPTQLSLMNASQFKSYLGDLLVTSGLTSAEIQELAPFNQEKPTADIYGRYSGNSDYYRYNNNTNWQDETYQQAFSQDYYLNIKGGDQTALYAISLGYMTQEGIMKNTNYNRFNTRFNSDITISDKMKAHTNMSFTQGVRNLQNEGAASTTNLLYNSFVKSPFTTSYKMSEEGQASPNLEDVDIFGVSNVSALANTMDLYNENYRFLGSISFDYTFNKNWRIDAMGSLHFNKDRERVFLPDLGVAHDTLSNAVVLNESQHRVERLFALYGDAHVTFNKQLSLASNVIARAGLRYQNTQSENDYGLAYNSSSDDFRSIGYGDLNLRKIGGTLGIQNWRSLYANADFIFQNKYLVSAILTADASSRYDGTSVFPTVSGAWLLSSEDFMQDVSSVNLLKIRISAGKSGNDDIGNSQNKKYYVSQSWLGYNGYVLGGIPNRELKPEITTKYNLGLDVSLLNERLSISADIYRHYIDDMLTYSSAPAYSGFDSYLSNGGSMKNTGFDVSINGRILNGSLKWDLGLNLSKYKNEVTKLDCGTQETEVCGATVQTKVGQPLGVFYGYQTNGIYQYQADAEAEGLYLMNGSVQQKFEGGDVRFVNNNALDLEINEDDRTIIGDPTPDLFGSIFSSASYHHFTLDFKLNYSIGGDVYNYMRNKLESLSGYENQSQSVLNRWRVDGQKTDMPKATWGDPMGNSRFSDRWIEDGSYLRLKTLTVGYEVMMKKQSVRSLNLFVTCENLLTFTKYTGLDPEFSQSESPLYYGVDAVTCPQPITISLGVKIGL
jgi:TonB-linked SusC/RagA family outer membrane protein